MDLRMKNKLAVFSIIHYPSRMIGRSYFECDGSVNSMAMKSMPFILKGFALVSINLKFSFHAVITPLKFYTYVFFIYIIYLSKCVMDG